jgi:hypothetical protein
MDFHCKRDMHKSAITFELLASSLVMLAVMPFLNNNAAIAQGYYNYGDSYSQYPTDDKKYECRTGPLEGFFVSSVEFCKHVKFDKDNDRKDSNQTGTQGPAGPAGAQGIQGIQGPIGPNGTQGIQGLPGPAGISVINASNYYPVIGNTDEVNNTPDTASSEAICDDGDIAISGSFQLIQQFLLQ